MDRHSKEDLKFLVNERHLEPVLRHPERYSKEQLLEEIATARDYIERSC